MHPSVQPQIKIAMQQTRIYLFFIIVVLWVHCDIYKKVLQYIIVGFTPPSPSFTPALEF
jgi:hypothetical protein